MAEPTIRKVCVIGAGTMGGGIASHLANLGFSVSLLDATMQLAQNGLERARNARPPHFYVPERATEIRLGTVEDHLEFATDADWVCEAIVERMDAKKALFARLDGVLGSTTMVSTNTSGLQIGLLSEGMSDSFQRRFMGTHFFNPPRYLRLLELIPTESTDPRIVRSMTEFLENEVARRVVPAKDTPGFIANRYGMWSMYHATRVAERLRLAVEDVDAITGPFLGRPRSGTFRLNDIVGIDVMRDVGANLLERCQRDPGIKTLELTTSMFALLARGWIGEKTGNGYYRKEGRDVLALDLTTMAYRMLREPALPALTDLGRLPLKERIVRALDDRSEVGEFMREYLVPALQYADSIKEEISYSVQDFDRVMMWGFGWELGPFALIDAVGPDRIGIKSEGPFYKGATIRSFEGSYLKIRSDPKFKPLVDFSVIGGGETYNLRDLGQGVTGVSLTTKMGVISPKAVAELTELLQKRIDRFVLTSEAKSFSAGFDLRHLYDRIQAGALLEIGSDLEKLQKLGELLARRCCVAAIYGHCLGAGLELALSCPIIVAEAETKIGLPESRVGLMPAGRGVALMRMLNSHSTKRLAEVTVTLTEGTVAPNADSSRQLGYLRPTDSTIYGSDQLIHSARAAVLAMSPAEAPEWTEVTGPLVGMIDRELNGLRTQGAISEYDEMIGTKIRQIVARSTSYEDALTRERTEFVDLCGRTLTQARIRHMLETGKPLRN